MKRYQYGALGLSLLMPAVALADFQYQETTQITGGSLMSMMKFAGHFSKQANQINQPVVATVYVRGNRMAHVDDRSIQIIDLDKGTITNIDLEKRTYTEMTFEQIRQGIEQGLQEAKAKAAEGKASSPAQQPPENVKLNFKFNVRNTGATKQIGGFDTSDSIMTMQVEGTDTDNGQKAALAMTADLWLTPDIPGYEEVREFERKLAARMGGVFSGSSLSSQFTQAQPGMSQGMSSMAGEVSQMKGIPIEQITRIGMSANGAPLPAASEAPLPADSGPQMPSAGDVAKQSAENVTDQTEENQSNRLTSKLSGYGIGGLGGFHGFSGFGHRKKNPPPSDDAAAQAPATAQQGQTATAVLMEFQTIRGSFSTAPIDGSKFAVPAGFVKIEQTMMQPQPVK
jgi:hypothetical protein